MKIKSQIEYENVMFWMQVVQTGILFALLVVRILGNG